MKPARFCIDLRHTNNIYLTTKDTEAKAEHHSVAKVKAGLEETGHLSLYMIVIYRI